MEGRKSTAKWRRVGETSEGWPIHECGAYRIYKSVDESSGVVGATTYWYVERNGEMLTQVARMAEAKAYAFRDCAALTRSP